jgi:hypothetical protein
MKNLSIWAKRNRNKAICVTIILHILLSYFLFYVGALFYTEKIIFPFGLTYFSGALFLIAYIFYPMKYVQSGIFRRTFFREKIWQFVAMISAAIFMVFIGNYSSQSAFAPQNQMQEYSARTIALDIKKDNVVEKKNKRKLIRKAKRQLQKRIRKNVRQLRKSGKERTRSERGLLIVLSVIVAVLVGFLVLGLSCSLACAGNEILAVFVLLGGLALIIFGIIAVVKAVYSSGADKQIKKDKKESLG